MFLFVILPFDSAQGERAALSYMACRGMSSLKGCGFFLKHFGQKQRIDFGHFGLKLGMVLNCLLCSVFCKRSYVVFHHYR